MKLGHQSIQTSLMISIDSWSCLSVVIFALASQAFSAPGTENFADLHFQLYCPVWSGCQAVALFPLSIRSKSVVSPSRRPWPDADQRARGENIRNIWTISGETRYYNIDLNLTPILDEGVVYVKNIVLSTGCTKKVISKNIAITPLKSIRKGKSWCVLENSA